MKLLRRGVVSAPVSEPCRQRIAGKADTVTGTVAETVTVAVSVTESVTVSDPCPLIPNPRP